MFEHKDNNEVEEYHSEDEVEELLRDLYPNLDGWITNADCDEIFEEDPNGKVKNSTTHWRILNYHYTKILKLQTFLLWFNCFTSKV